MKLTETPVDFSVTQEVKDFTRATKNLKFRIDEDIFEAPSNLPAMTLMTFAAKGEELSSADSMLRPKIFEELFQMILLPESAQRFIARLSDQQRPISMTQVDDVLTWIMEEYGLRPTIPSEESSDGAQSQESGRNLMVNALPEVSTLNASPLTGS